MTVPCAFPYGWAQMLTVLLVWPPFSVAVTFAAEPYLMPRGAASVSVDDFAVGWVMTWNELGLPVVATNSLEVSDENPILLSIGSEASGSRHCPFGVDEPAVKTETSAGFPPTTYWSLETPTYAPSDDTALVNMSPVVIG